MDLVDEVVRKEKPMGMVDGTGIALTYLKPVIE